MANFDAHNTFLNAQLYINATELERTAACYAECTRLVTSLNKLTDDQKAILDEKRKLVRISNSDRT